LLVLRITSAQTAVCKLQQAYLKITPSHQNKELGNLKWNLLPKVFWNRRIYFHWVFRTNIFDLRRNLAWEEKKTRHA